jgi:hypothetical protein
VRRVRVSDQRFRLKLRVPIEGFFGALSENCSRLRILPCAGERGAGRDVRPNALTLSGCIGQHWCSPYTSTDQPKGSPTSQAGGARTTDSQSMKQSREGVATTASCERSSPLLIFALPSMGLQPGHQRQTMDRVVVGTTSDTQ